MHGTGLRLGKLNNETLTPVIAVRNIGKTATVVTTRVPYAKQNGDTGVIALPKIELGPSELKLLNTANAQFRQSDFATAGLEIEHNGAPGSVIATAKSVSTDGNQVFAVPLKDPQGGMSSTGGYPWFITPTASTVVFIKNTTQEPQKFHVTVTYAGGKWGSDLKTLAPGQTYALDLKKARDAQEKGADNGNPIPDNASSGHISWTLRGAKDKVLIGRAQTVDFTNALASTYECQCVCGGGYVNSYITPNSATGFIGDTTQFNVYEIDSTCYGGYTAPYLAGGYFTSANPSIATVNSTGYGTCVSVGTTSINNELSVGTWQWAPFGGGTCEWNPFTVNHSASCEVQTCPIPTSETTISTGWDDIVPSQHKWQQRLHPIMTSFNGRRVYESTPSPGQDDCWFPNSARPIFNQVTNDPNAFWTVNSVNEWGPDKIGWSPASVTYYRAQGRAPCQTIFTQQMKISCGSQRQLYVTHQVGADIGTTTVSSLRAGESKTRDY